MYRLHFESNLKEKIRNLIVFKNKSMPLAKWHGLNKVGWETNQEIKTQAKTGVEPLNPISKLWYVARDGTWKKRFGKRRERSPFGKIKSFMKYEVYVEENRVVTGLGPIGGEGFDDNLMRLFSDMQEPETIKVTDSMRGLFGSMRKHKHWRAGDQFFPLSKETVQLKKPGRPVVDQAFSKVRDRMSYFFENQYSKIIAREAEKL